MVEYNKIDLKMLSGLTVNPLDVRAKKGKKGKKKKKKK